ncbi:MAG: oligosaccharide flippase family protein, partial [Oscillospiraceae bacterium]|nr:oligosaccharide flippase family protein [Oscillospiraceae bacterium]
GSQNYYFIVSAIIGFILIIFNACTAGIGNSLIVETQEKNFNDLKKITFLIAWLAGVCSCCFLCLFQPFMMLWMGEEYLLPFSAVICLVIYYFVYEINQLLNTYKDAGGIWRQDRFRPLVTAGANLCMNLIMVQFWGIYGILLSTVLSMLIVGMPWLLYNLFNTMFNTEFLPEYLRKLLFYTGMTAVSCFISCSLCHLIPYDGIAKLALCFFAGVSVPNILFFICYHKMKEFQECAELIDKMTKGKLHLKEKFCQ